MNLTTLSSRLATGVVAAVAGFASYSHIVKVAKSVHEADQVAFVLPLSIDGLIVVGTMAMLDDKRHGRRPRTSARVALGFGIVATLAANVASAQPSLKARLVAAVPAIAFLIAVEVLARVGRQLSATEAAEQQPVVQAEPDSEQAGEQPEQVDSLSTALPPVRKPQPSSRERVERAHKRSPEASNKDLAKRLELSAKTVQRYRPERAGVLTGYPAKLTGQPAEQRINGHDVLEDAQV